MNLQQALNPANPNDPFWILNESKGESRGPVIFNIERQGTNQRDTVIIADTWLPINLLQYVSRNQLSDSANFRNAINTGIIRHISDEEAQRILSRKGAKEELKLIEEYHSGTKHTMLASDVDEQEAEKTMSARCQRIAGNIEDSTCDDISIVNDIRKTPSMTRAEAIILRKKAKNNGRSELLGFLRSHIKRMKGA